MVPLTEYILESGLASRPLSFKQVSRLVGGSRARCYGQINRALKADELIQIRRGLYLINPLHFSQKGQSLHPFVTAQQIFPGSYVSVESALAFHGWIPESVHTVSSVVHESKSITYDNARLGRFEYRRMTPQPGGFLQMVSRHELPEQVALVAEPLRALLDLVYLRKAGWQGLDFLTHGLRVDSQLLQDIVPTDINKLKAVYKGKREQNFLCKLKEALHL